MWRVLGCMLAVGCGPIISEQSVEDEEAVEGTTTASVASTGSPPDVSSEGGEVSGAVDFDLGGGSVDPPSCAPAGACDDCFAWDVSVEAEEHETVLSPAVAPDGTIVTLGTRGWDPEAGVGSIVVARHDPSGERLWDVTPPLGDGERTGMSLDVADDGRIALTGFHYGSGIEFGSFVASLTADGLLAWIDEEDAFELTDVEFVEDDLIVVGALHDADGSREAMVRRYDPAGTLVWESIGDPFGHHPSVYFGVALTASGDFVLTGATDDAALSEVWLGLMSPSGDVQWSIAHDGDTTVNQWGSDVALLDDGDIIAVGVAHEDVQLNPNGLSWAGRFSPDGETRWTRTYPGTGCCANGLGSVEVDATGRIFVAGMRGLSSGTRVKVQELDCEGNIAWQWEPEGAASLDGGLAVSDGLFVGAYDWDGKGGRLIRLDP